MTNEKPASTAKPANEPSPDAKPSSNKDKKKSKASKASTRRRRKRSKVKASESNSSTSIRVGQTPGVPWWFELVLSTMRSPVVDQSRSIYTNRSLRLDRIHAVGFDFDHTLAVYNCEKLDGLAMEMVIDRLVAHEDIPRDYLENIPDPSFAVKGLLIDKDHGNVLKIDRYGHVANAYHGTERLTTERRALYGDVDVIPHVTHGDRFVQVDSAFAKPEVLIFASAAPHLPKTRRRELWDKIRFHTDAIHRDGSLKAVITANPRDFLKPDLDTVALLMHLREGGKQVFLLTNSEWHYTAAMMNASLGIDAPADNVDWLELFDLVVVLGGKPRYFNRKTKRGEVLGPSHLLEGGNISDIEERLDCVGPDVLYVGDHIYSDLITSKRRQNWRTMMVIAELEEEQQQQSMLPGIVEQLKQTEDRRIESEREVQHWNAIERALDHLQDRDFPGYVGELRRECSINRQQSLRALRKFIDQRERLRNKLSTATNPFWGSLFRSSAELTYYGRQLEDFACIYTSRATNMLFYATDHYFRSAMDYLPHELEKM